MNITIYNEFLHEKEEPVKNVYPDGIHGALREILADDGNHVTVVTLEDINSVMTKELIDNTDVMLWWGHVAHNQIADEIAELIRDAVLNGMGFIALHSAHMSKPFRLLMGTSCTLKWRLGARERVWVTCPGHPIAQGLPEQFELPDEEMYGEFFDVPDPDDTVFIGWYASGEVFRSGITYQRGYGKVFYFQPGHEEYPIYYNQHIQRVIKNAVKWSAPATRVKQISCCMYPPLENNA